MLGHTPGTRMIGVGGPARGQNLPRPIAVGAAIAGKPAALRPYFGTDRPPAQAGGSMLKRKRTTRKMLPSPLAWVGA